jgi:hypothetical protein
MATQIEPKELDLQERLVRIRRQVEESEKFSAETRKLVADMTKVQSDLKYQPWFILFQGVLAVAALMGAGAAITKFFLP